jgi:hypothetical protein
MAGTVAFAQMNSAGVKAGAAWVDITPTTDKMAAPFKLVSDHVYVRALALVNGAYSHVDSGTLHGSL